MKKKQAPLLAALMLTSLFAGILWRRNVHELVEMRRQAAVESATAAAPQLPHGAQPALMEENHQTRAMTVKDLRSILDKTRAELKSRPKDADLHMQLAVALSLAKSLDDAAGELETAARLEPNDANVRGSVAMFYIRLGDVQSALPHLQRAHQLAPTDLDSTLNLAKARWSRGEMETTLKLLEGASKLAGKSAEAHEKLAGVCTELPVRVSAVKEWKQVLALKPDNALALQQLAFYELEGGNLDSAKAMIQKALAIEPQQGSLHSLRGTAYVLSEPTPANLQQAESSLNKALELGQSQDSATHYYFGKLHQRRGDFTKAASEMETAIKINPVYREAHYDLAQIYTSLKRTSDANEQRQIFEKIYQEQNSANLISRQLQTTPNNAALQFDLAKLQLKGGHAAAAMPHLQKALELRPNWKEVREKLAMLHRAMGRPRQAEKIENAKGQS